MMYMLIRSTCDLYMIMMIVHFIGLPGAYTEEEDTALLLAIQRHTNTRGQSISDIPLKNLPWTAIAQDLGNERTPLDYLRHWPNLRRSLLLSWGESGVRKADAPLAVHTTVEKKTEIRADEGVSWQRNRSILRYLVDRVKVPNIFDFIEDESDIVWAEVDRACDLSHGESGMRESLCICMFICFHNSIISVNYYYYYIILYLSY